MVYNVILMETIGISVMVSFGLLFFFSRVDTKGCCRRWRCVESEENCKTKHILNYILFYIKGIKIMASDVINYKCHIKSMLLW